MPQQDEYNYLVSCSNAYYNTGQPLVSDAEFDRLVDLYEATYNTTYTYLGKSNHAKAKLPYYMGSLDKCKTTHQLQLFMNRHPNSRIICTDKLDGLSLMYANGKLYTRGDGSIGSDVSHLLPYLNLPRNCPYHVRGELVLPKSIENARNLTAGLVNSKTVDTELIKQVKFIAYTIYDTPTSCKTYLQSLNLLHHTYGFNIPVYQTIPLESINEKDLATYYELRCKDNEFDIDGIVLQFDEHMDYVEGYNPKTACAFKIQNPTKQTRVISVEWNVSAFKTWHPIVCIEPVQYDGITIRKCSGFHAQYILTHKIGPGAIVDITRSGDVIPDIVNVVQPATEPMFPPEYETGCYSWKGVHLYRDIDTVDSLVAQLLRFFTVMDATGMKEQTIKAIIEGTPHRTEYDFLYKLKIEELTTLPKFGDKKSEKLMQSLHLCREQLTLPKLCEGSAMFKGFASKKLEKLCASLYTDIIQDTTIDKTKVILLCKENGIHKNAEEFYQALDPFRHKYKELLRRLNKPIIIVKNTSSKTVVFSGFRDAALKTEAETKGYTVSDSLTKSIHYLVVLSKEETSGKIDKAKQYQIPIISKEEFKTMLV